VIIVNEKINRLSAIHRLLPQQSTLIKYLKLYKKQDSRKFFLEFLVWDWGFVICGLWFVSHAEFLP
jgi:hypothetical protein